MTGTAGAVAALRARSRQRVYDEWVLLAAPAGDVVGLAGLVASLAVLDGRPAGEAPSVVAAVEALGATDRTALLRATRRWPAPAATDDEVVDRAWAAALRHLLAAGQPAPDGREGSALSAEAGRLRAERAGVDARGAPVGEGEIGDPRAAGLRPITRRVARTLGGSSLRALRLRPELADPWAIDAAARVGGVAAAVALELGVATGRDVGDLVATGALNALDDGASPIDVAPAVWAVLQGWRAP